MSWQSSCFSYGVKAVEALMREESGVCVCSKNDVLSTMKIEDALKETRDRVSGLIEVFNDLL